jgi:3-(3-hydroxy-phenyl)propionate hydroxylase
VAPDAPLGDGWLIDVLGRVPVLLVFNQTAPAVTGLRVVKPAISDVLRARYLGTAKGAVYLIRPDQVIAARWMEPDADTVRGALCDMWEGR